MNTAKSSHQRAWQPPLLFDLMQFERVTEGRVRSPATGKYYSSAETSPVAHLDTSPNINSVTIFAYLGPDTT